MRKNQITGSGLPGYPHYGPPEDITTNKNKAHADIEQITASGKNVKSIVEENTPETYDDETLLNENGINTWAGRTRRWMNEWLKH